MRTIRLLLLGALACAAAQAQKAPLEPGEVLLERGGELQLDGAPPATLRFVGDDVEAFAQTEVPGDSRLQAALAMVDALVRAELLKSIQVGVAAVDTATQTSSANTQAQASSSAAAEAVKGVLPKLPLPEHGWVKVKRDGAVLLRLHARIKVARATIAGALQGAVGGELAARAMSEIEKRLKAKD
jgi:hypothetical protein